MFLNLSRFKEQHYLVIPVSKTEHCVCVVFFSIVVEVNRQFAKMFCVNSNDLLKEGVSNTRYYANNFFFEYQRANEHQQIL